MFWLDGEGWSAPDYCLRFQKIVGATVAGFQRKTQIQAGRQLAAQVLAKSPNPACLYFPKDDLAAGGLFQCQTAGIAVPEPVFLARFNELGFIDSLRTPIAPR